MKIYLAGKIGHTDWRHKIVKDLRDHNLTQDGNIIEGAVLGGLDYCGPFFIACDHGCSHSSEHGFTHHGRGIGCYSSDEMSGRTHAWKNCLEQIRNADVLFAWIDSEDCFGTLTEIGYAYANGVLIMIGTNKMHDNLWFAYKMAGLDVIVENNATDAFIRCCKNLFTFDNP